MTIDSDAEVDLKGEDILLSNNVVLNDGKPKQEQGSKQMWNFSDAVVTNKEPETTADERAPFQQSIEERV